MKMVEAYDNYIRIVTEKGEMDDTIKKNLLEAYSNVGSYYAVTDKVKAKEYFAKALEIDPNDEFVKGELQKL